MLSFIKRSESFKPKFSMLNPLIKKDTDMQVIKETLRLQNHHFVDVCTWECPICYDTIKTSEMMLCFPFTCNHITCFKCFKKMCDNIRKRFMGDITDNMKCCLCRSKPNKFWDNSKTLCYYKGSAYKHSFHVVLTKDI